MFSANSMPAYHDGMLAVQMKTLTTDPAITPASVSWADRPQTSGYAALSYYERAGLLKKITPISDVSPNFSSAAPRNYTMAMFNNVLSNNDDSSISGSHIIEIQPGHNTSLLRAAIATDPNVEKVDLVPVRYLLARSSSAPAHSANDGGPATPMANPPPANTLWNLSRIRWSAARAQPNFREATNVKVGVLDTGVDVNHPDLRGRIKNYVYKYNNVDVESSQYDIIGHGTHVCGVITAADENNIGIDGICDCDIHVWKIFSDAPTLISTPSGGDWAYIVDPVMYLRALSQCADQNLQVLNLSIGGPAPPNFQESIQFSRIMNNGTIVCAAMGNERRSRSPTSYPAAINGVVAVGATNIDDTVASFSSSGGHIALSAPGVAIWSTLPTYAGQTGFEVLRDASGAFIRGQARVRERNYAAWDGTSMATPHVTGCVALMLAINPNLSSVDVRNIFNSSADKVRGMAGQPFHPDYGAGVLNVDSALKKVHAGLNQPTTITRAAE